MISRNIVVALFYSDKRYLRDRGNGNSLLFLMYYSVFELNSRCIAIWVYVLTTNINFETGNFARYKQIFV